MTALRIPELIWTRVHDHLFSQIGEHFAFMLAKWTYSLGDPVLMVREAILVPDHQVKISRTGWELTTESIISVINKAVASGDALIEAHNHGGVRPRFSLTDRQGLEQFPPYILDSLPGRPYAATVWGDTTIYGEVYLPNRNPCPIGSILVTGHSLHQLVSRDDDDEGISNIFSRQIPWFTSEGQRGVGRLTVGVAGAGGTGSPLIQNLVYLGVRNFVLIDDDDTDESNMNRLVTAKAADLGTSKVELARRMIKSVVPNVHVRIIRSKVQSAEAIDALKGVDILFGCFDNDGARLILNELALSYGIPYFDLAVGIEVQDCKVQEAGGRVAVILPGGPCLNCMGEIDPKEAQFFLSTSDEQALQIKRGYVRGLNLKAPSVVSLNAAIAAAAINELAVFTSGLRPIALYTELDLLGNGRQTKGQWMTPKHVKHLDGCVQCAIRGNGDASGISRYAVAQPPHSVI
jgi:molybdopterin/thiamine biosynthesis adenylyltransferase